MKLKYRLVPLFIGSMLMAGCATGTGRTIAAFLPLGPLHYITDGGSSCSRSTYDSSVDDGSAARNQAAFDELQSSLATQAAAQAQADAATQATNDAAAAAANAAAAAASAGIGQ